MTDARLSFVVPARNEEALIGETIDAILASIAHAEGIAAADVRLADSACEVVVVDDASTDATARIASSYATHGVQVVRCRGGTCGIARNIGVAVTTGRVLCFVDADTIIPANAVKRVLALHERDGKCVVLYRLQSREPGVRAWLWWNFWGLARHLPLARAKSMPAFMSCDRAHFDRYGPFDTTRSIAEEWPLTGSAYRHHPDRFLYDRSLTARTSSRRMELRPFGYARTFLMWACAVLFPWARTVQVEPFRHQGGNQ